MPTTKTARTSAKKKDSWVVKERRYILKGNKSPISSLLRSSHHPNKPLQYFDGDNYRPLRYASNSTTPFMDEQDGYVISQAIEFENGELIVPAANVNLQKFLFSQAFDSFYHLKNQFQKFLLFHHQKNLFSMQYFHNVLEKFRQCHLLL